jgi:YLP motif-containing protein 1
LARLIKDKEVEEGSSAPRLLSIDDYFLVESEKTSKCEKTGRNVVERKMIYEYEADLEETYMQSLIKSFKKTISDGLFDFIIVDCNNERLKFYNEFHDYAKLNGFMVSL